MPVLSMVELELVDDDCEREFLATFAEAAEAARTAPGLLEIQATKRLDAKRTYVLLSLWETEVHLEAWYKGPREREKVRRAKAEMVHSSRMKRFVQMDAERRWERG